MPPGLVHFSVGVSLLQRHSKQHTHTHEHTFCRSTLLPHFQSSSSSLAGCLLLQMLLMACYVCRNSKAARTRPRSAFASTPATLRGAIDHDEYRNQSVPLFLQPFLWPVDASSLWCEAVLTLLTRLPALLSCGLDIRDSSGITELLQSLPSIQLPLCCYVLQPLSDPSSTAS